MTQNPIFPPDFTYAMDTFYQSIMYDLNCHKVGIITKFNPEHMTVDIQIKEKANLNNQILDYPVVLDCPLVIYGVPNSNLTFGDVTGAEVILHFADKNIDRWFETGEAYLPNNYRMHSLSDGFAELSPRSMPNMFEYDMTGTVLYRGGNKIKITDNDIQITNGSVVMTISGDTVTVQGNISVQGNITATGDVKASNISLKQHIHSGVTSGSGVTGIPQ